MTILTLLQEVDKVKYCKADLHRETFVLVQLITTAGCHMSVEIRY